MELTGFINDNDISNIKVSGKGIKLEYENKDCGDNKKLVISGRYKDSKFTLEGENSSNYEIVMEDLPAMYAPIHYRPINIYLYGISKEYDGTDTIDSSYMNGIHGISLQTSQTESNVVFGNSYLIAHWYPNYFKIVSPGSGYRKHDILYINYLDTVTKSLKHSGESLFVEVEEVGPNGEVLAIRSSSPSYIYGQDEILPLSDNKPVRIYHHNYKYSKNPYQSVISNSKGIGLVIEYNFIHSIPNIEPSSTIIGSDVYTFKLGILQAKYPSKDVTDHWMDMTIENINLTSYIDDKPVNYKINKVYFRGFIYRKPLKVNVKLVGERNYDGTKNVTYAFHSFEGLVSGDDVSLDMSLDYFELPYKRIGGYSKSTITTLQPPRLTGKDASNYEVLEFNDIVGAFTVNKKDVNVNITSLSLSRTTGNFRISYTIDGEIPGDDLSINVTTTTSITLSLPDGDVVNIYDNHLDKDAIVYRDGSYGVLIYGSDGRTHELYNNDVIKITGFELAGKDANNYNLLTSEVSVNLHISSAH